MVEQETWAGGQGPGQIARACQADLSCHGWCGLQQCAVEKIQLLLAAGFGIGQQADLGLMGQSEVAYRAWSTCDGEPAVAKGVPRPVWLLQGDYQEDTILFSEVLGGLKHRHMALAEFWHDGPAGGGVPVNGRSHGPAGLGEVGGCSTQLYASCREDVGLGYGHYLDLAQYEVSIFCLTGSSANEGFMGQGLQSQPSETRALKIQGEGHLLLFGWVASCLEAAVLCGFVCAFTL